MCDGFLKGARKISDTGAAFVLSYALEDFCREPLPKDSRRLDAFAALQKVHHDQLIVYLTKEKVLEDELIAKFEESRKVLDEVRRLGQTVEDCRKRHFAPVLQVYANLKYEQVRQSNEIVLVGLGSFLARPPRGFQ